MGQTVVKFGDPKAQKKWSSKLAIDTLNKSYWERFIGASDNSVIQRKTELQSSPGDRISFDLSVQLRGKPTVGDNRLKGNEEGLKFFTDEIIIDQIRKSVSAGGRMTRKRTAHDLRSVAKDRLSDYWGKYIDELFYIYLSGARGINQDYTEDLDYTGHAGNTLRAPDGQHLLFGGAATSVGSLTADDKMGRNVIERAVVKASMMRSLDPQAANMLPININGGLHYVCVMSKFQEYDLRQEAGAAGWLEIQKAAAASDGRANPIFKGGLGLLNDVVLHSHAGVIRFNNYGAAGNVDAARALFLGRQAGVVAFGTNTGLRFAWEEEVDDYGNEPTVASGTIIGVSKTRFNKRDFGLMAIDTAARNPN